MSVEDKGCGHPSEVRYALEKLIGRRAVEAYEAYVLSEWVGSDDYWTAVEDRAQRAMEQLSVRLSPWTGEPCVAVAAEADIGDWKEVPIAGLLVVAELKTWGEEELEKLRATLLRAAEDIKAILED
jgi:hypothetical protein